LLPGLPHCPDLGAIVPPVDEAGAATVPTAATANADTRVIGGDFRLDVKLGEGAMGVVYKAHQISMDRTVALKILASHLTVKPEFVERFRREAKMSVKLDHPNVVRGIAVGEDRGQHYFAMDFVDGENLQDVLGRTKRLGVADGVRVALDVARALSQAERRAMVHRDIKPANIMVTNEGVVKLADLGLAKVASDDSELTATGVFFGTPPYMAPEQFHSTRAVDTRSDIYSLGATLYHLVTGEKPFRGSPYECLTKKERREWTPAGRLNPEVPEILDRILARTMEPNPQDRYQSASDLVADLEASGLAGGTLALDGASQGPTVRPSLTRQTTATAVETKRPRVRTPLAVALAVVLTIAGALALRSWMEAPPAPKPPPVTPPNTGAVSAAVARILTRAYGEVASGQLEEARRVLRNGLQRHPSAAALELPLRELEQGGLVLFQYQTAESTLPLTRLAADDDLTLTQSDNYRFALVTTRPCFLYAFQIDDRPSVSQVFPNPDFSPLNNPVSEGKVHWLPDAGSDPSGSWFHLDDFKGNERIVFVGLTRPLREPRAFGERLLADSSATLAAVVKNPAEFVGNGGSVPDPCFGDGAVQELRFRHG
jgi:serine/threonine protein kinase